MSSTTLYTMPATTVPGATGGACNGMTMFDLNKPHVPVEIPMSRVERPVYEDSRLSELMPKSQFEALPAIAVKSGTTDYIDTLSYKDVTAENKEGKREPVPIVCYVDHFRRPGIAMNVMVRDARSNKVVCNGVYAVFQRYTDNKRLLVMCRSHYARGESGEHGDQFECIIGATTALSKDSYTKLQALFAAHHDGESWAHGDFKITLEASMG